MRKIRRRLSIYVICLIFKEVKIVKKSLISIILLITMTFSCIPIVSADDMSIADAAAAKSEERQIIVINGIEYDVTGWSAEDIDLLKQTNQSGSHVNKGDISLNDKYVPDYTIDKFIEKGWSGEAADIKKTDASGEAVENESAYEASLRLMIGLGVLSRINEKNAGEDLFTVEDFKKTVEIIGMKSAEPALQPKYGDKVTGNELINYLVDILGFYHFRNISSSAERNKIEKGVDADFGQEISREAASQLIRNTMSLEFIERDYMPCNGKTIFENMNIIGITGWVNANDETNIFGGDTTSGKDVIQINNADFKIQDSTYYNCLGDYVDAFVMSEFGATDIIISMHTNKNANKVKIEINPKDISDILSDRIVYYIGKFDKTVKVNQSTNVVRNGEKAGVLSSTSVELKKCDDITLYDVDKDNVYDYIVVVETESYIIDQVKNNIILVNDYAATLDYTNVKDEVVVYINGKRSSLDKIEAGGVISVADKKYSDGVTLYISTKTDEGNITTISKENITVEGANEPYELSVDFSDDVQAGAYCIIYFDYLGKVAFIRQEITGGPTPTGRKYAYLLKATPGSDSGEENTAYFRMWVLGQKEGEWKTFTVKGKLTLEDGSQLIDDGKTGHNPPKIRDMADVIAKKPALASPQLVVIDTDVYGNLTKITTAYNVTATTTIDENVFQYQKAITESIRVYGVGFFGGQFVYNSKTIAISVPTDRSREDLYCYVNAWQSGFQNAHIYDAGVDRLLKGVVVRYDESSAQSFNNPKIIVVKDTKTVYDESSGEVRFVIVDGKDNEYWVEQSNFEKELGVASCVPGEVARRSKVTKVEDILPGDMMRVEINSKNEITLFAVDIRCSDIVESGCDMFLIDGNSSTTSKDNFSGTIYMYGRIVLNGSSENSMLANLTGDGTDPINNRPISANVSTSFWEYSRKRNTVTKISRADFVPGDYIVQYNSFWYIGAQTVRIVD